MDALDQEAHAIDGRLGISGGRKLDVQSKGVGIEGVLIKKGIVAAGQGNLETVLRDGDLHDGIGRFVLHAGIKRGQLIGGETAHVLIAQLAENGGFVNSGIHKNAVHFQAVRGGGQTDHQTRVRVYGDGEAVPG